jgi:hypothetical protein
MKKSLIVISLVSVVFLISCKKDKETDPFEAKYTTETVEQSKANVEQNAIELVDQLDALASAQGLKVLIHLNDLGMGMPAKSIQAPVFEPLSVMSRLDGKKSISEVFEAMKNSAGLLEDDPLSFSAMFDSIAGKYTYNFTTEEFDKTALADKVIIEFPGKETDHTNTAMITVENFTVAEITAPIEQWPADLAPELPASIKMTLKYNDVTLAGVSMNASYKSNGMPAKVTVEVFVDEFTLTLAVVHDPYSSASYKNTLKFKKEILFETYVAAEGNWSPENLENNTDEGLKIQNIIKNANAHVIMMNLQVLGRVNMKALGDSMELLGNKRDILTEEQYAKEGVKLLNNNATLIVIYRDSNKKIAEAEAYVESRWDDYEQHTEYYPSIRFKYADGSLVSVETYVNNELDGFYDSMNDFIDTLNNEYDLNLEYVGPQD